MKRLLCIICSIALLAGCSTGVSQAEYNLMMSERDALQSELDESISRENELERDNKQLKDEYESLKNRQPIISDSQSETSLSYSTYIKNMADVCPVPFADFILSSSGDIDIYTNNAERFTLTIQIDGDSIKGIIAGVEPTAMEIENDTTWLLFLMQAIQCADPSLVNAADQEDFMRALIFEGEAQRRNGLEYTQMISDRLGTILITIKPR